MAVNGPRGTPPVKQLFEPTWLDGPMGHHYRRLRPGVEQMPWDSLDPSALPPPLVERARLSWTEAAYNEYCTAAAFAELMALLLAVNAPINLVALCGDFMADEMLHVELTSRLATTLGGGARYRVDLERLTPPFAPGLTTLQKCNEAVVRLCCVGESFSLPMLAGCLRSSTHPLVQAVLTRIVKDEALHGRLGFEYLEWVDDRLDAAERARLAEVAVATLDTLAPLWQRLRSEVRGELTSEGFAVADVRQLGWMLSHEYRAAAHAAVRADVVAPLAEFGIRIPEAAVARLAPTG